MLGMFVHRHGLIGLLLFALARTGSGQILTPNPPTADTDTRTAILPLLLPPGPTNRTLAIPTSSPALVWEATSKDYEATTNETMAHFTFSVTNVSAADVVILGAHPSCGCTVAQMPSSPWRLMPGASGQIQATTDLRGKRGVLNKFITVESSVGRQLLQLKITLPEMAATGPGMDSRDRNRAIAMADHQAVFRGECARCHAEPAAGKRGEALFTAVCDICHGGPNRASMVPDLQATAAHAHADYWRRWIRDGKEGTLMPAFARAAGGPLTPEQIESLIAYLGTRFASAPSAGSPPDGPR